MSETPEDIDVLAAAFQDGFTNGNAVWDETPDYHKDMFREGVRCILAERTRALSQLEAGKTPEAALYVHPEIFSSALVYPVREREMASKLKTTGFVPLYRSALASPSPAPEAEPGAWQWLHHHSFTGSPMWLDSQTWMGRKSEIKRPLYTTPTPAVDADAVIEAGTNDGLIKRLKYHQGKAFELNLFDLARTCEDAIFALSLPPSADKGE